MRVLVVKPTDTYYADHGLAFTRTTTVVTCAPAPFDWKAQEVIAAYRLLGVPARLVDSNAHLIVYRTRTPGRQRLAFADWRAVDRHLVLVGLVLLPRAKGRTHRLWRTLWTRRPRPSTA